MKTQSWSIKGDSVRVYPDMVDGKPREWAEYSLQELREMFWALHHVMEQKTQAVDQPITPPRGNVTWW